MIVHKFGGAAVKDAEGVRNLFSIIKSRHEEKVIVVSALGKTTNSLEQLTDFAYQDKYHAFMNHLEAIRTYHQHILDDLFPPDAAIMETIRETFGQLAAKFELEGFDYDFLYDQIVSFGEILSTHIISAYISSQGIPCRWMDIRKYLVTDNLHREANIDWEQSRNSIRQYFETARELVITQGFIAGTAGGIATTLGREGSDYTAAVLANILEAEKVIIWKDVPGVMNADPRFFEEARKLDGLSYQEAIELAYYGAKVIHPKTIKPLQNKKIPLLVYSFVHPEKEGTLISDDRPSRDHIPVYILKQHQMLISILPKDLSFVFEERLSRIYSLFAEHRIQVNLMQHSAVTFSVAVDEKNPRISALLDALKREFRVLYNTGLELITIRYYTEQSCHNILKGRKLLVEQKSRHTAQFIVED